MINYRCGVPEAPISSWPVKNFVSLLSLSKMGSTSSGLFNVMNQFADFDISFLNFNGHLLFIVDV